MSTFDEREKQFEAKFHHDQELQFKVMARRNRLFGEWAGTLMGLQAGALKDYAAEVVQSDFEKPGDEDVFAKVKADLEAKSVAPSDHLIRKQMDDLLVAAKKQLMAE